MNSGVLRKWKQRKQQQRFLLEKVEFKFKIIKCEKEYVLILKVIISNEDIIYMNIDVLSNITIIFMK